MRSRGSLAPVDRAADFRQQQRHACLRRRRIAVADRGRRLLVRP
jgi:hypothetical protein